MYALDAKQKNRDWAKLGRDMQVAFVPPPRDLLKYSPTQPRGKTTEASTPGSFAPAEGTVEFGLTSASGQVPGSSEPRALGLTLSGFVSKLEAREIDVQLSRLGLGGWFNQDTKQVETERSWIVRAKDVDERPVISDAVLKTVAETAKENRQQWAIVAKAVVPGTEGAVERFRWRMSDMKFDQAGVDRVNRLARAAGLGGWTLDPRERSVTFYTVESLMDRRASLVAAMKFTTALRVSKIAHTVAWQPVVLRVLQEDDYARLAKWLEDTLGRGDRELARGPRYRRRPAAGGDRGDDPFGLAAEVAALLKYAEDQPRDEHGRWTTMYHVTAATHRESIAREGLRLSDSPSKFVWLWPTREMARKARFMVWGGSRENDVYEVDVRGLDVQPDPHGGMPSLGPSYVVAHAIPPSRVRRLSAADLLKAEWDESKHPRVPAGSPEGGEFASEGPSVEKHQEFIRRLRKQWYSNPINPREIGFGVKIPGEEDGIVMVELHAQTEGVHISALYADPRGKGLGTQLMKQLVAAADRDRVKLTLGAQPFGTWKNKLTKTQLIAWYGKFGFKPTPGFAKRSGMMTRAPQLAKYSEEQPREPAGSPTGGRWVKEGSGLSILQQHEHGARLAGHALATGITPSMFHTVRAAMEADIGHPVTEKEWTRITKLAGVIYERDIQRTQDAIEKVGPLLDLIRTGEGIERAEDWYRDSRAFFETHFAKEDVPIIAGFLAVTSLNADAAGSNVTQGMKAWAQFEAARQAGKPITKNTFQGFMGLVKGGLLAATRGEDAFSPRSKIVNFVHALLGDENAVVIDRWMTRAFGFPPDIRAGKEIAHQPTPAEYQTLSEMIRVGAARTGLTPASYQAVIWSGLKRKTEGEGSEVGSYQRTLMERLHNGGLIPRTSQTWKSLSELQRHVIERLEAKWR